MQKYYTNLVNWNT